MFLLRCLHPPILRHTVIKHLTVDNKGWELVPLASRPGVVVSEQLQIRGYDLEKHEQKVLRFTEPGSYVVDE